MKNSCCLVFCLVQFLVCGCAIHPLPDDVTGLSTYDIVRQNRCEAREAVADAALDYLQYATSVDERSRAVGIRYASDRKRDPDSISGLKPSLFQGAVRDMLALFWNTGIAYTYTLEMTENNNLDSELNLIKPIRNGSALFGFKAGLDRQRKNTRTFTVTDTFSGLVEKIPRGYCNGKIRMADYIYPIAGKIGINKMIQDFVYLTLFGNLTGKKDDSKGPPTMVDSLGFRTIVTGTASPKVTFLPAARALSVMDASVTGVATRTDDHQVVIGLALATAAKGQLAPVQGALFTSLLTATGGPAEKAAAAANDQFLTRTLFRPTVVVNQ